MDVDCKHSLRVCR